MRAVPLGYVANKERKMCDPYLLNVYSLTVKLLQKGVKICVVLGLATVSVAAFVCL